jgi:homocysteine S-methyltransferase
MNAPLLETIQSRVLLADGNITSELYNQGFFVNSCYEQLNLTQPNIVKSIHESFSNAGADILITNTFAANRLVLNGHGISDQTKEINQKGVELAREAAGENTFVLGSIGQLPQELYSAENESTISEVRQEQAGFLIEAGVDAVYLESYSSLDVLATTLKSLTNIAVPIVPSIMVDEVKIDNQFLSQYKKLADEYGIKIVGINGLGPQESLDITTKFSDVFPKQDGYKLFICPSIGNLQNINGRLLSMASPEYMAEYTRRLVQKGAAIVGGDCGVTPKMVREMCSFLRSVQPGKQVKIEVTDEPLPDESMTPVPMKERTLWGKKLGEKFMVSVELDPPKGIDAAKSVEGAKFLYENGIDAVNIADGPRASGRMSPTALALLVRQEVPIETIIHVCCRDRNILALQMDLISANALDLKNVLLITGDPPKMGMYPDATAVFDFDAIGLIQGANWLNQGLDFAKRPLQGQTEMVLGIGCNPGANDLDLEVARYEQKVAAGAEFVFSQPVYDPELISTFLKRIKEIKPIPFFVGILPLASYKNAEFLHTQVPGMQIPDEIRERMRKASDKEAQRKEGISIAAESLKEAKHYPQIQGAYIFPPFGRYSAILDVLEMAEIR